MILLYDDDCGICTKYSKIIGKLRPKLPILPMHHQKIMAVGIRKIGYENYWKSFHMVNSGVWTTESSAITELAKTFPFGNALARITKIPPIKLVLSKFLNLMQRIRKSECMIF